MTKPNLTVSIQLENTSKSRREFVRKITAGIAGVGLLGAASTSESEVPTAATSKKNLLQDVGADYHVDMNRITKVISHQWWMRD